MVNNSQDNKPSQPQQNQSYEPSLDVLALAELLADLGAAYAVTARLLGRTARRAPVSVSSASVWQPYEHPREELHAQRRTRRGMGFSRGMGSVEHMAYYYLLALFPFAGVSSSLSLR